MGVAQSSKNDGIAAPVSAPAADISMSDCGFSRREAQYLSDLRLLVRREWNSSTCFVAFLLECSQKLALESSPETPSLSSDASSIEAHLLQHVPRPDFHFRQLHALFTEFASLKKMSVALEKIFINDDDGFLERVSNALGMHGGHRKDPVEFIFDACSSEDESLPAKDAVELCFHTASAVHYILQEHAWVDSDRGNIELAEKRNISSEDSIVQSMADSLLEHVKNSRDVQIFLGHGDPMSTVDASVSSVTTAQGFVTKREFSQWQRKVVPDLIYCSVAKFLRMVLLQSESSQSQQRAFSILRTSKEVASQTTTKMKAGQIMPISSQVFGKNTMSAAGSTPTTLLSPPIFAFASISMAKFGKKWYRIFSGADDGWTFQSLEHSILGFEGPTLLVIRGLSKMGNSNAMVTFGAYTASKWEKNKRAFFGTSDCFLFQLLPTLRVLKPLPKMGTRGGHYMYFHSNTNLNTSNPLRKDDLALGMGFGGTMRHPRLLIDSHLEKCHVSHQDSSFEEGHLGLPPSNDPFSSQTYSSTLHIDSLEIFAVGDEGTIFSGFKAQHQHRDIVDATLRNARTVDRAAFLGDMRNGLIETQAFAHRGQVDGRAYGYLKGAENSL